MVGPQRHQSCVCLLSFVGPGSEYHVRGFIPSFTGHLGRGQEFMVCSTRKSPLSTSASLHWLQGGNTGDSGASSRAGTTGSCCPVIKGQSLNRDEQGCNEKPALPRLGRGAAHSLLAAPGSGEQTPLFLCFPAWTSPVLSRSIQELTLCSLEGCLGP